MASLIQRPSLQFFLGFILAIVYIPGWVGAAVSTSWFFLLFIIPILLCFCKIEIKNAHKFGFLFLAYVCLSLAWTQNFNIGFFILLQIVVLGCVFCLGSCLNDMRSVFKGLALGLGVSALLAIAQFKGFADVYTLNNDIAGLFVNPNVFCEVSVILFLSLIILKLWWWILVTLPGIILVHSRAALLALICGLFIWLWPRSRLAVYILGALFLMISLIYYSGHDFSISSIDERFALWKDTIRGFKIFGNGVGSFEILYPKYAINVDTIISRPKYAHNEFLHYWFEFGIGTLLLIPLIWNVIKIKRDERIILYGIGIVSLFAFPMHIPVVAFIGCLAAGYITRFDAADEHFRLHRRSTVFSWNKAIEY